MAKIKEAFEKYCPVVIDRDFAKRVILFIERWKRKDEDTINFLGGNLIGQQKFVMDNSDIYYWIEDLLGIEEYDNLDYEISQIPQLYPQERVKAGKRFRVSGNPINLSFFYIAHKALTDSQLSKKESERLAIEVMNFVQYKFFSSIYTHYLPYKTVESIAMATYEGLSRKWGIKVYGTWEGLFNSRSQNIICDRSIHRRALLVMDDDYGVVKMINDVQGRLKSIIGNLIEEYKRIRDLDSRIESSSSFMTTEEGPVLKDKENNYSRFRERMHDIIPDKNNFIKEDLVNITTQVINTVTPRQLVDVLYYMSDNYSHTSKKTNYPELVDDILVYTLELIRTEKMSLKDIPGVIGKVRNMFRSSRVTDPLLKKIRANSEVVVKGGIRSNSSSTISSVRIALIVYIVMRALIDSK